MSIKGILQWIISLLQRAIGDDPNTPEPEYDIVEVLRMALKIAETGSQYIGLDLTKVIAFLKLALENKAVQELLYAIIGNPHTQGVTGTTRTSQILQLTEGASPEVKGAFEGAGLSWDDVKTIIPYVVRILLTLLNLRPLTS